ncbi:MAG: [Fe-Fe] hydrogenase large subunit C-terminal domain-containing protein [Eubacteriales bacterium]|nr:[Fe-Fe] hydrogenase large subunit C-terminal domain-containing protein [Eubacteriales bacterium]
MSKLHSVRLNKDLCVGCTNCIKRCPTQAIRVRDGKAQIAEYRCIDCGECIRACPHHAKSAVMDPFEALDNYKWKIALAAPSLYAQFGAPATRTMVLAALKNIGFDDVYEVAIGADIITARTNEFLDEARRDKRLPLISSACPAVVRLVQMKYPGLIDNLVPFDAPVDITAQIARRQSLEKTGLIPEDIGIFFISPCPAKRTAVTNPIGQDSSQIDGVIAISDAYPMILAKLEKLTPEQIHSLDNKLMATFGGVRWGYTGGEAIAVNTEKYLAVDGIHNVISILEEVENERLRDIEFIEANSCTGGCIGGPLTVANRYSAKSRQRGYIEEAKKLAKDHPDHIYPYQYEQASVWTKTIDPNPAMQLDSDIFKALEKYEQMEQIVRNLPGLDCGACGAPDCLALAEDIVRGEATETDCIFKLKEKIRDVASQLGDLESAMNKLAHDNHVVRTSDTESGE